MSAEKWWAYDADSNLVQIDPWPGSAGAIARLKRVGLIPDDYDPSKHALIATKRDAP